MKRVIIAHGRTDIGRVRTNNEDSYLIDDALGLYVVADGMGGHNAGEVASRMAVEILHAHVSSLAKTRDQLCLEYLADGIRIASKRIFELAKGDFDLAGMG